MLYKDRLGIITSAVKNKTKYPYFLEKSWAKLTFRIQISVANISLIDCDTVIECDKLTGYNYKGFLGCQWIIQEVIFAVKF